MNSSDGEPACFHASVVKARGTERARPAGGHGGEGACWWRIPRQLSGLRESLLQAGTFGPAGMLRLKPLISENFEDIQAKASVKVSREAAGPGTHNILLFLDFSVNIQVYWQLQHFP